MMSSSNTLFLVRYGWQGNLGRVSTDLSKQPEYWKPEFVRGQQLVVDCGRGPEPGEFLGTAMAGSVDGHFVRPMSAEDQFLLNRLQSLSATARDRCNTWLEEQECSDLLLEVEALLDGKTLIFHFLNPISDQIQEQVDNLVQLYVDEVSRSDFAKLVQNGCGPGCGTTKGCQPHASSEASGAASGCANCSSNCFKVRPN